MEYLIGYEGNDFALAGDPQENILSITAVHPMREEALRRVLAEADIDWSLVDGLVKEGKLVVLEYRGKVFYMRKLPGR